MAKFPPAIQNLINQFNKLPGIGPKTSERLVFYLLKRPSEELMNFSKSLEAVAANITRCHICHNVSEKTICPICSDKGRDQKIICIVAETFDLLAIENTDEFNGLYHVLNGCLNPLEGITPEHIRVKELIYRLKKQPVQEIILALNPDMEGESTTIYLSKILKPFKTKITKLARGLPSGANLEYADQITLANALKGRQDSN